MNRNLREIVLRDPGVGDRLHSPKKVEAHLRRRGFITALGWSTPLPPLHWTSVNEKPSPVHGHAWLGLDDEAVLKVMALGFLPPRVKRPTLAQVWEFARGKARMAMLEGERYALYQEAALAEGRLLLKDPLRPTLAIPTRQRCDTQEWPTLKFRCRATFGIWVELLDFTGRPVDNPNYAGQSTTHG